MSTQNQPAAVAVCVCFTIFLDSPTWRSSAYKLWKVQDSLNKQDEGGPGPRGLRLPWQASLPQTGLCLPPPPPTPPPAQRAGAQAGHGLDLRAVETAELSQLKLWPCRWGTGGGFSAITAERTGIFFLFLDVKTTCWAWALVGGGITAPAKCSPCGVSSASRQWM